MSPITFVHGGSAHRFDQLTKSKSSKLESQFPTTTPPITMLNMYPRHQLQLSSVVDGGDENVEADGGYNPFYAIAVVCVSILLFCVLVASVSSWKALAYAALAALVLGVAGSFAPKGWFRPIGQGASAELVVVTVTTAATGPAVPGHACALVNAPPAFLFQSPAVEGGAGGGDAVASASSCVLVCSVCLEDVRGGEMVRQVPACRHVFHVACIDMWLHSHRTCPMCRCVVSPPVAKVTPKDTTAADELVPESSDDHELPPV